MIAKVTHVTGKVVTFSAGGKSGIRSTFTCMLQGKKPPKVNDEGILELYSEGRRIRFVSEHKFYEFLYPRAEGMYWYGGPLPGDLDDLFVHAELNIARTGRRLTPSVSPPPRSMGEVEELPGNRFAFKIQGDPVLFYEN